MMNKTRYLFTIIFLGISMVLVPYLYAQVPEDMPFLLDELRERMPAELLNELQDEMLNEVQFQPISEGTAMMMNTGRSAMLDVLDLKGMDILDVLKLISQKSGLNIVAGQAVKGRVTVYLKHIEVLESLRIIVEAYGWAYAKDGDIIKVMTAKEYEDKYGHKFGHNIQTRIQR